MVGTSTRARLTCTSLASSHLELSSTRVLDLAVPSAQLLPFPAVLFLPDPFWAPAVPAGCRRRCWCRCERCRCFGAALMGLGCVAQRQEFRSLMCSWEVPTRGRRFVVRPVPVLFTKQWPIANGSKTGK